MLEECLRRKAGCGGTEMQGQKEHFNGTKLCKHVLAGGWRAWQERQQAEIRMATRTAVVVPTTTSKDPIPLDTAIEEGTTRGSRAVVAQGCYQFVKRATARNAVVLPTTTSGHCTEDGQGWARDNPGSRAVVAQDVGPPAAVLRRHRQRRNLRDRRVAKDSSMSPAAGDGGSRSATCVHPQLSCSVERSGSSSGSNRLDRVLACRSIPRQCSGYQNRQQQHHMQSQIKCLPGGQSLASAASSPPATFCRWGRWGRSHWGWPPAPANEGKVKKEKLRCLQRKDLELGALRARVRELQAQQQRFRTWWQAASLRDTSARQPASWRPLKSVAA